MAAKITIKATIPYSTTKKRNMWTPKHKTQVVQSKKQKIKYPKDVYK